MGSVRGVCPAGSCCGYTEIAGRAYPPHAYDYAHDYAHHSAHHRAEVRNLNAQLLFPASSRAQGPGRFLCTPQHEARHLGPRGRKPQVLNPPGCCLNGTPRPIMVVRAEIAASRHGASSSLLKTAPRNRGEERKPCLGLRRLPHAQRAYGFAYIVDAHNARAAFDRQQSGGQAARQALGHWRGLTAVGH